MINLKEKKKIIGSIVILIIFSVFLVIGHFASKPQENVTSKDMFVENNVVQNEKSNKSITVYVNGEVKSPGVYSLKYGSRVKDLVEKSGGFTESADSLKLNLAKKLKDEDYIYVDNKNNLNKHKSNSPNNNEEETVNINSASKEELKTIPGIGDVTAQKIVDYREKNGGFDSIDDMKKIDRIGEKTFQKIKDKIDIR